VLAAAILAAALAVLERRRAVSLGLVALLTVLAAETALHSVHHAGDADAEASCAVVCATAHLGGVTTLPPDLRQPAPAPERADERASASPRALQPVRPREGRAPPVSVLA
jgi:hypothetical protein